MTPFVILRALARRISLNKRSFAIAQDDNVTSGSLCKDDTIRHCERSEAIREKSIQSKLSHCDGSKILKQVQDDIRRHCEVGFSEGCRGTKCPSPQVGAGRHSGDNPNNPIVSEAIQKKRSHNEVRDDKLWYILPAACHRGRRKPVRDLKEKAAFTLAEVLITLGIIGIVAAMTMPMLIAKYQKIVTATQLKRTYSLLYNAHLMAVKDFGDMEYWDMPISSSDPDTGESIPAKITQTEFVEKYYMPYLRTSGARAHKFTDTYHAYNFNGQDAYFHDGSITRGAFFRLADGSCITLWSNNQFATFTTDVNCQKAPNIVGRDVFDIATVFNTGNRKFEIPRLPRMYISSRNDIIEMCKESSYGGGFPTLCFLIFTGDGWTFKDDYPWK